MSDIIYQNQELTNPNPTPLPTDSSSHLLKLPKNLDPKVKLLIILGAVIFILLIISLFVTLFRKKQPPTFTRPKTTPTVYEPKPTDIPEASAIPDSLKQQFAEVDNQTQMNINFPPPQIDPDIGL